MSALKKKFRPLHGILLLDKPQGLSSNQALQRARHLLRAEKAGHTGSLDPLATGMLPICFGEATKIAGLLLGERKAYRTTARLGITTDSDDADGQVLRERDVPEITAEQIHQLLKKFHGKQQQRPPIFSALKQGGEPLYAKARRGEVIEVPEREIEVFDIRLIEMSMNQLVLEIECGSGTYIRSIVRDLGEMLGCGAHVEQLRRLWVSPFIRDAQPLNMVGLDQLETMSEAERDALLLPISLGLQSLPEIVLDAAQAQRLRQGQRLKLSGCPETKLVHIHEIEGESLGLGRIDAMSVLHPERLFVFSRDSGFGTRGS
jgi:tRNA pseudouridine55 synthase